MGRPLASGLPEEFASWVLAMLRDQELVPNRAGRLRVDVAAYHEADSGRLAFGVAAIVLKRFLVGPPSSGLSADVFERLLNLAQRRSSHVP
jgi:hypothetical protein